MLYNNVINFTKVGQTTSQPELYTGSHQTTHSSSAVTTVTMVPGSAGEHTELSLASITLGLTTTAAPVPREMTPPPLDHTESHVPGGSNSAPAMASSSYCPVSRPARIEDGRHILYVQSSDDKF